LSRIIKAGSLVCTNRKTKGQGIVLERVKNINEFLNYNVSEAFLKLYDKNHPDFFFQEDVETAMGHYGIYQARNERIQFHNLQIRTLNPNVDKRLLLVFWSHNSNFSSVGYGKMTKIRKPKVDFCKVHWFKSPSDYGYINRETKCTWFYTRSIKNVS